MAGKGFAPPRSFRGDATNLRVVSQKNWEALVTHLNQYVPFFDEDGNLNLLTAKIEADALTVDGTKLGFYSAPPVVRPDITGIRQSNTALTNLLIALADLGLITDSTTAT